MAKKPGTRLKSEDTAQPSHANSHMKFSIEQHSCPFYLHLDRFKKVRSFWNFVLAACSRGTCPCAAPPSSRRSTCPGARPRRSGPRRPAGRGPPRPRRSWDPSAGSACCVAVRPVLGQDTNRQFPTGPAVDCYKWRRRTRTNIQGQAAARERRHPHFLLAPKPPQPSALTSTEYSRPGGVSSRVG